jgi:hypothetical protein
VSWNPFNKLLGRRVDAGEAEQEGIVAERRVNDPLGDQQAAAYHSERMNPDEAGYLPRWKWVAPPGIHDAPQWVWDVYNLIPFSLDGPWERPFSYLKTIGPSGEAAFAMRYQGMAVETGEPLMYGLTEPDPQQSPGNDIYGLY